VCKCGDITQLVTDVDELLLHMLSAVCVSVTSQLEHLSQSQRQPVSVCLMLQIHYITHYLRGVKQSHSQTVLSSTYPNQLPLSKATRHFVPCCISKKF